MMPKPNVIMGVAYHQDAKVQPISPDEIPRRSDLPNLMKFQRSPT